MSEYESLRTDIECVADSLARYSQAVGHATGVHDLEIRKLWADNAELRDELHAVANRVENLTRFLTTEPAEVAERMPFVCAEVGCYINHPHEHKPEGVMYR